MSDKPAKRAQECTTPKSQNDTLTPQAKRALAEAEDRRNARKNAESTSAKNRQKEIGGRKGPDPVRFGDWENGGIISDF